MSCWTAYIGTLEPLGQQVLHSKRLITCAPQTLKLNPEKCLLSGDDLVRNVAADVDGVSILVLGRPDCMGGVVGVQGLGSWKWALDNIPCVKKKR